MVGITHLAIEDHKLATASIVEPSEVVRVIVSAVTTTSLQAHMVLHLLDSLIDCKKLPASFCKVVFGPLGTVAGLVRAGSTAVAEFVTTVTTSSDDKVSR